MDYGELLDFVSIAFYDLEDMRYAFDRRLSGCLGKLSREEYEAFTKTIGAFFPLLDALLELRSALKFGKGIC